MGKCQVCGKSTKFNFPLCKDCNELKEQGKITQCKDCGEWYDPKQPCKCKKKDKEEVKENKIDNELTCIICGEPSNGKHFCLKCYRKYKEKVILLKVHKCEFPTGEPLDESYEGVYECQDGHIVKSIAEQTIDDELCNKGIFHAYESLLDIGEDKPLKPDFCLKNYLGEGKDVYIEYFGLKGQPKYDEHTEYKMKHYRKLGITLICLYPKDSKNLKFALQSKVFNKDKIKIGEINHEEI